MTSTPRLKRVRRSKPRVGSLRWFRRYRVLVIIGWVVVLIAAFWVMQNGPERPAAPRVVTPLAAALEAPLPVSPPEGKTAAALPSPAEDAPHQGKAERWAYSGHLQAESGEVYSFYVAAFHMGTGAQSVFQGAVLEQQSGKQYTEQLKVEGKAVVGRPDGFGVSSGPWQIEGHGAKHLVKLAGKDFSLDLAMDDGTKPVAVLLDAGATGKNHYVSRPRMKVTGSVTLAGASKPVRGEVWFDHQWGEFEASSLRWNWFGLQLADGADVMIYQLLDRKGAMLLRTGSYAKDGVATALGKADFKAAASGTWRSPSSGVVYPMDWTISVPGKALELKLEPVIRHSQFNARASGLDVYWVGAVKLSGSQGGTGFMVLSGYEAAAAPALVKKKK